MDRYQPIDRIGEGAYGVVFKARDRQTNDFVALKRIRCDEEGIPATAHREIALLKAVRCENVVTLRDAVQHENRVVMALEFLQQDLKVYIDSCPPTGMDPILVRSFSYQLLNGLAALHSAGILHRDLKPQNLLIDSFGILKLADFGLARKLPVPIRKFTHEVVTLWYRPPEILLGDDYYSTSIDLWSASAIIAEMSNLAPLLPGDSEIDQLFRIFRLLGTPSESVWPGVERLPDFSPRFPHWPVRKPDCRTFPRLSAPGIDLIQRLLVYHPSMRLTAKEALDHAYFAEDV